MRTNFIPVPAILLSLLLLSGCADISIPSTKEMIQNPIGSTDLSPGMPKSQVIERYGEPDAKQIVISDEWNNEREEWFYMGRYTTLPVNAGYLSKDLYLYFDGENLTNISKRPIGRSIQENINDVEGFIK